MPSPPLLDPEHPPPASALPRRRSGVRRLWPQPVDPLPFWLAVLGVPILVVTLLAAAYVLRWDAVLMRWVPVVVLGPLVATALIGRVGGLTLQRTLTLIGYSIVMTFVIVGAGIVFLFTAFLIGCTSNDYGCGLG